MKKTNDLKLHVYPHNDAWAILREDEKRPSCIFNNANEALMEARKMSKNLNAELIVHNRKGEIQYKQKYEVLKEVA